MVGTARASTLGHYEARLLDVLARHVPLENAQTIMQVVRTRVRLSAKPGEDPTPSRLVREIVRALDAFVPRASLVRVAVELEETVASMPSLVSKEAPESPRAGASPPKLALVPAAASAPPAERLVPIEREPDIAKARLEARSLCLSFGASPFGVQKCTTVVSELARNIVSYTPGGLVQLIPSRAAADRSLVVRATDRGRWISNLDDVLNGHYRSTTGMGMGLRGVRRLCERFDVQTGTMGTIVEVELKL